MKSRQSGPICWRTSQLAWQTDDDGRWDYITFIWCFFFFFVLSFKRLNGSKWNSVIREREARPPLITTHWSPPLTPGLKISVMFVWCCFCVVIHFNEWWRSICLLCLLYIFLNFSIFRFSESRNKKKKVSKRFLLCCPVSFFSHCTRLSILLLSLLSAGFSNHI